MNSGKLGEKVAPPQRQRTDVVVSVILAVSVLIVFSQTLGAGFINYDDDQYVYENPAVASGLTPSGILWAFTQSHASNWHPLTWISHMLDCEIFGLRAGGHHLTNVFLHATNSILLFVLLRRLTGACWRSAFVAALFALHPLHVESVAWVSERKDVLSTCFGLLTLLMYARYAQSDAGNHESGVKSFSSRDYWWAVLFFSLGLMSKPMLVTLPFVMGLLDYWPLKRVSDLRCPAFAKATPGRQVSGDGLLDSSLASSFSRRSSLWNLVLEKIPFLVLSLGSCVATVLAQKTAVQPLAHIPVGIRAANAVVSYARYLRMTFWPVNLAIPYLHRGYDVFWVICISAVLLLGITASVVRFGRRFPFLVVGWFWYLGMLVPVIGLVQVGMQAMADRYTYMPLLGVFIMLAWGLGELFVHWRVPAAILWTTAVLVLVAAASRAFNQVQFWSNSETLFRHTLRVDQNNETAHYNLGHFYFSEGHLDEAIRSYRVAIQIKPDYDDALANLGVALARNGQLDEAISPLREAIRYRPDKSDSYYNLGNVLVMQRRFDEAAVAFREALRRKPDYPEAHNNLANILLMQGKTDEAVRHLLEVLRLDPNHEKARQQLRSLGVPAP